MWTPLVLATTLILRLKRERIAKQSESCDSSEKKKNVDNDRLLRLRAHVYVFKKIRFRKDPFWGVQTYRTSIRRPRSHGRGLIPGNVPQHLKITAPVYGLASSSNRTFLFVSFACQGRSSVLLHVLVHRGRSVRRRAPRSGFSSCWAILKILILLLLLRSLRIMEAGYKRKAPKVKWNTNKRRSKMKQKQNTPP